MGSGAAAAVSPVHAAYGEFQRLALSLDSLRLAVFADLRVRRWGADLPALPPRAGEARSARTHPERGDCVHRRRLDLGIVLGLPLFGRTQSMAGGRQLFVRRLSRQPAHELPAGGAVLPVDLLA